MALIVIGDTISPEIAVGGFHSQAGWISFLLIAVGVMWLGHSHPFFATAKDSPRRISLSSTNRAMLLPFIVLLACTIVTSAFTVDFDGLYPLRVIGTSIAIAYCSKHLPLKWCVGWQEITVGFAVYVLWINLAESSAAKDFAVAMELNRLPLLLSSVWILCRFLGHVLVVPVAEEMAFRGYLLPKLAGQEPTCDGELPFSWLSFIASSVLFGILHSSLVAGVIAGMAYAVIRYRRQSVWASTAAHGMTNFCLFVHVIVTGRWSLL